jgi:hypothetical protein
MQSNRDAYEITRSSAQRTRNRPVVRTEGRLVWIGDRNYRSHATTEPANCLLLSADTNFDTQIIIQKISLAKVNSRVRIPGVDF